MIGTSLKVGFSSRPYRLFVSTQGWISALGIRRGPAGCAYDQLSHDLAVNSNPAVIVVCANGLRRHRMVPGRPARQEGGALRARRVLPARAGGRCETV